MTRVRRRLAAELDARLGAASESARGGAQRVEGLEAELLTGEGEAGLTGGGGSMMAGYGEVGRGMGKSEAGRAVVLEREEWGARRGRWLRALRFMANGGLLGKRLTGI